MSLYNNGERVRPADIHMSCNSAGCGNFSPSRYSKRLKELDKREERSCRRALKTYY